jgi:glycerophosphoryl diester phosphodiesterase
VPTVYLMHRVPVRYRDGTLPSRTAVAGPRLSVLRRHPSYVQRVHDQGHRVFTWVVDTDEDIDLALELGVDSIISDDPRRVVRRLGRR